MKRITIITGHYGTGKTNISVNIAVRLANEGKKVTVVDLDLVNPYFRTADFENNFARLGISLLKPMYANTNLDIPAIGFELEPLLSDVSQHIIIDVGGDDAGATALGRFSEAFSEFSDELDMLFVINQMRLLTKTAGEAAELMREIEKTARLKHTGIVNNTNLGAETTADIVEGSFAFAEETAALTGLPLVCTTCRNDIEINNRTGILPVEIYVKLPWD